MDSQEPRLITQRVVVMTSSFWNQDIERTVQLGANSVFIKPGSYDGLVQTMRTFRESWLSSEAA